MNLSEQELAKKIVQHIATDLLTMESEGDIKFNMSHLNRQIRYRRWAEYVFHLLEDDVDEQCVYVGQFDGSAKPNPGIMKIGGHIKNLKDMETTLWSFSIGLGEGTNNRAEYLALIELLEIAIKKGIRKINIYGDSDLAVKQVNGKWKANKTMAPLRDKAIQLLSNFDHWSLSHVPRALNSEADALTR